MIQMYWDAHAPPHFHAMYAEFEIVVNIKTLDVIKGKMPKRAIALVIEWAKQHQDELLEDWELCKTYQSPKKISPLQ